MEVPGLGIKSELQLRLMPQLWQWSEPQLQPTPQQAARIDEKKNVLRVPVMAQRKQIWLGTMRWRVWSWPRSVGYGSSIALSCGVGHRWGSDPMLLWLWCKPAAVALIRPLAWELPYAMGTALKRKEKKKKKKKEKKKKKKKELCDEPGFLVIKIYGVTQF